MDKRRFLRTAAGASLGLMVHPAFPDGPGAEPEAPVANDEAFWSSVRKQFRLNDAYINLENGFYSFQPEPVLAAFIENVRDVNLKASHYMRTRMEPDKLRIRERLAEFAGCSPDELIVTRNTTESLDTVIAGFDWKAGDEAVMAYQDYPAMLEMFKLQARRHGMINRLVHLSTDPRSDEEIVQLYANALTAKTRLLMISHMINITGQILPVRDICAMAHARGVQVMVDGAHTFAHLDYRIPDLQCDYFGASLHKWLAAPLGAGILYVRRDRIASLWPIYADKGIPDDDIRKLNHTGTHPVHTNLTIERAISFHEMIGSARKEARLRYLQQYWTRQVRTLPKVVLNTPTDPRRSCAIANVGVQRVAPADLARSLLEDHRIYTVAVDAAGVRGVRVTPQIHTSLSDLNALTKALRTIAA